MYEQLFERHLFVLGNIEIVNLVCARVSARCQAALAERGQSELRMLAQMQAQAEMREFGNRLQQAGGWLESINPDIPAAPSIPQTLNCSYFGSTGYTCR